MIPYIFLLVVLTLVFFLRKLFSQLYFTPTGFLAFTWMTFIFLKLIFARDYFFSMGASVLIAVFVLSFFAGEFFLFLCTLMWNRRREMNVKHYSDIERALIVLKNDEVVWRFRWVLIIMGLLSFCGSILYVNAFVNHFGSLENVLSAGWALRGALEEIYIPLFTRIILLLGYSSIVLTLIYYLLYKKFSWYFVFPFLSLLIMGITQAGRAGFIMIIFQIFISSYWSQIFDNLIKRNHQLGLSNNPELKLLKSSFRLIMFVVIIFVGGDMLRSQNFGLSTDVLGQGVSSFKSYLFGGIAGFTTYLNEHVAGDLGLGRYSFSALYDLLGIHENTLGIYTNYLRISGSDMLADTNIFTAFRQYIDDFGLYGTALFMFLLGAISHIFFTKAIKGNISSMAFLIVFYTYLFHIPLLSITVHNSVLLSAFLPGVLLKLIQKKYMLS